MANIRINDNINLVVSEDTLKSIQQEEEFRKLLERYDAETELARDDYYNINSINYNAYPDWFLERIGVFTV